MFGALFYYRYHSWRNRLTERLRRLRQPKYLAGAIMGGLYFYFYLFHGFGGSSSNKAAATPEMKELTQTLAALSFMVVVAMCWFFPKSRAGMSFTEAEIAFLFPAPVSRRTLINLKLMGSQPAILFSSLIVTLIRRRTGGGPFLPHLLGWYVGMSVFNFHVLGSSFAITMLMDRGITTWKRRGLILGAAAVLAVGMVLWARHSLPPLPADPDLSSFSWLVRYVGQVFASGPMPYLLVPFRMVVAPYFAVTTTQFLSALGPVLCILLLHYLWVVHSDVAFEEASVEQSRKLAEAIAAVRAGQRYAGRGPKKPARSPFMLRPAGPPAVGVFWKNCISAGQYVTLRFWLMLLWIGIIVGVVVQTQAGRGGGEFGLVLFMFPLGLLMMSLFSGPQLLRNDLRQDLRVADVLKMFPMPGWQIVLGEVLTPAAMMAAVQWLLIVCAAIFCPAHVNKLAIPLDLRLSVALAAAIVLPFVDLLAMLIPNASVLFFPAWFQLGKETPRGFETMGQQLILMFGQMLALLLGLLPAACALTLSILGGSFVHWPMMGLVLGAIAAALILAVETGFGIKMLGGVFERFDLSGEVL